MTSRSAVLALSVCSLVPLTASARKPPVASTEELAQITERGRLLYAYDQAAWHATDAVLGTRPAKGEGGRYIAQQIGGKWVVRFGHLSPTRDAFLLDHVATEGAAPDQFTVEALPTPRRDTGFAFIAAKAVDLALQDFQPEKATYNVAVLPAPAGQLYVYLYPAQTQDGIFPLGGDERYIVSADGATIIDKHRMHHSILNFDTHPPDGSTLSAGFHVHVLSAVPEDSDVFYVLNRRPSLPELIGVDGKIRYQINPDGTIVPNK